VFVSDGQSASTLARSTWTTTSTSTSAAITSSD
jgi:hypothetical protein